MDKNELINQFNNFENKIKENNFQQNKGLGNDIGYYIFDYPIQHEEYVLLRTKKLKEKINNNNYPFKIQEFDIYDLVFDIIKEKNYLDKIFQLEEKRGTEKTLQAIQSMLKLGTDKNLVSKKILEQYEKNTVIFITGIGKIYPIVRAHDILNNLNITEVPLVVFYPGKYTGTNLKLFTEIDDTNYYRALTFERV